MNKTLAMILAGGQSRELPVLTAHRSKAALPYGGRYRIIDFCLSNCANSGIRDVGILAQYNPASLIAHVGDSRPWDLNRRTGGLLILQPYAERAESNWFRGTADALWQHREVIEDSGCEDILLLSADQVYRMDYSALIGFHRASGSSVSLVAKRSADFVPGRYGALDIGEDSKIIRFVEKPQHERLGFFSLGIYAFKKPVLLERISSSSSSARNDIVFDVIMPLIEEGRASAYVFDGYWVDIGWLQDYYDSSMELLSHPSPFDLNDRSWPILTRVDLRGPSLIGRYAKIRSSLIAKGCFIEGDVSRSILFPGVTVEQGAKIENTVVFSDTIVENSATLRSCIVDQRVRIGREAFVGFGEPELPNSHYPDVLSSGLTIVGKRSVIPEGIRVGRNCILGSDLSPKIIPRRDIGAGETILRERNWQETS